MILVIAPRQIPLKTPGFVAGVMTAKDLAHIELRTVFGCSGFAVLVFDWNAQAARYMVIVECHRLKLYELGRHTAHMMVVVVCHKLWSVVVCHNLLSVVVCRNLLSVAPMHVKER